MALVPGPSPDFNTGLVTLVAVPGPLPDFDTGLVGFAIIAGAAFLAHRRRRT
jgi:hypothetical protein